MASEPSIRNRAALTAGLISAAFGVMILLSFLGALTSVDLGGRREGRASPKGSSR